MKKASHKMARSHMEKSKKHAERARHHAEKAHEMMGDVSKADLAKRMPKQPEAPVKRGRKAKK